MTRTKSNFISLFIIAGLFAVALAARAQTNLIASDNWSDGNRTNVPSGLPWFALNKASLYIATNSGIDSMVLSNSSTSSRSFFTYFTNNPVIVPVGRQIRATLIFIPTNIDDGGTTPQPTARAFRFGMFNVANGVVTNDSNGEEFAGAGVGGYVSDFFVGPTFNNATNPVEIYNRTNSAGTPLTDTTTNFLVLGTSGPAAFDTNANAGFQSGVTYTLQFSVAVYAGSNIVTTTITGNGLNGSNSISYSQADTNSSYLQTAFNSFQVRCNRTTDTADYFDFTSFMVQTMPAPAATTSPIPLVIQRSGGNVILSWTNAVFSLQSSTTATGGYTAVTATSPYTNAASGAQKYFRLISNN